MNLNKSFIAGRLTKDPELKQTKGGQNVTTFSMATNRTWVDKNNQKQEQVEYHNIVVWGRQADSCAKFLVKGQQALVEGRLQTRSYDAKDGSKRYVTEIVAERVSFGQKPQGGANKPQNQGEEVQRSPVDDVPVINIDDEIKAEDLPF